MGNESTMVEWFDDLKVGMRFKSGAVTVSKEDIVRFAAEYDPQPPFDQGHPDKAAPEVVQMFRAAHASFTQQAERIAADLSGNGESSN